MGRPEALEPAEKADVRTRFKKWVFALAEEKGVSHMTIRRAITNEKTPAASTD